MEKIICMIFHPVTEKEKMDIFINSFDQEMSYRLELQCPPTFEKLIKNGIKIEEALVKQGILKIYNENNSSNSSNNHKPKFWKKYKNNGNDTSAEMHNAKPIFNLSEITPKTNQTLNQNNAN